MVKANSYLNKVFGMELIPLIPREAEEPEEDPKTKKGGKASSSKKKKKQSGDGEEEESSSSDDLAATAGAAKSKQPSRTKKAVSARTFALRTLLPASVISKAILPMPERVANDPNHTERFMEDVEAELGSAGLMRDELKEWKLGRDEVLNWKTGPEQRTLMGILNVILALIMVNERVLTDGRCLPFLLRRCGD